VGPDRIRRRWILLAVAAVTAAIVAVAVLRRPAGLEIQVLDVAGYTDPMPIWMPFRVTLGLGNSGRTPVVVSRIIVEPDLDGFDEAYSGAGVLQPPLRIDPGNRASYRAAVMLLNANQLPERTYALTLRVRVEREDGTSTIEFPAEFQYTREPATRVLRTNLE
jgi:hypothetical protein